MERIAELTGVAFPDLVEISDERLGKDQAYLLNSSKLRQELAWTDTIGLEEGVVKTLEWVDENLETLLRQPQAYVHKP